MRHDESKVPDVIEWLRAQHREAEGQSMVRSMDSTPILFTEAALWKRDANLFKEIADRLDRAWDNSKKADEVRLLNNTPGTIPYIIRRRRMEAKAVKETDVVDQKQRRINELEAGKIESETNEIEEAYNYLMRRYHEDVSNLMNVISTLGRKPDIDEINKLLADKPETETKTENNQEKEQPE